MLNKKLLKCSGANQSPRHIRIDAENRDRAMPMQHFAHALCGHLAAFLVIVEDVEEISTGRNCQRRINNNRRNAASQSAAHRTDQCESLVRREYQSPIAAIYDTIDECNLRLYIVLARRSIPVNYRSGAAGCNLCAHMCSLPVHRAVSLRNKGYSGRRF